MRAPVWGSAVIQRVSRTSAGAVNAMAIQVKGKFLHGEARVGQWRRWRSQTSKNSALVGDAADVVRELARGSARLRDEVHVFLHALDLGEFFTFRGADGVVEAADVIEQFRAGCCRDGQAAALSADLCEEPRVWR